MMVSAVVVQVATWFRVLTIGASIAWGSWHSRETCPVC
jgi:hypothetical protein